MSVTVSVCEKTALMPSYRSRSLRAGTGRVTAAGVTAAPSFVPVTETPREIRVSALLSHVEAAELTRALEVADDDALDGDRLADLGRRVGGALDVVDERRLGGRPGREGERAIRRHVVG